MNDKPRIYIRKRDCKRGVTYHLRWIDPATGRWCNKKTGSDRKLADREAAKLEDALKKGTFQDMRRVSWREFQNEHVSKIRGEDNRSNAEYTLRDFAEVCKPVGPHAVNYRMIETYIEHLRDKKNSLATRNKRLRYLRSAFNRAIKRGYLGRNPMADWQWETEDKKPPRIVSKEEETALLDAAEALFGSQLRTFIYVALNCGARRGELMGLTWDRVDLDEQRLHFALTKGKRDRYVPISPEVTKMLQRLQVQTLRDGGPFVRLSDNLGRMWRRVILEAEVSGVSIHDLRRTYVTRLIRAGVPLPTVQALAGHQDIQTTLKYYNWTSDGDLREGVDKLARSVG